MTPPVIHKVQGLSTSLHHKGPFSVDAFISDNVAVDTNSVYLYFSKTGTDPDSLKLEYSPNLDIYHATNYLLPVLKKAYGVLTIHDLSFIRYPEFCQKETLKFQEIVPNPSSSIK